MILRSDSSKYWDDVYSQFHKNEPPRASVWNEGPTSFFVRLIPFLKHIGAKTVMDAGCGDGRNIKPFLEQGFDVTGVDESRYALEICRKNYPDSKNLKLIPASLTSIPLPDDSLDALICDHVITHVRDINEALDNFHRLLKEGGHALLEFTSPKDSTYGQGKRISPNEFNQDGVYLRYDTPEDIDRMLHKFDILCFTAEYLSNPAHGPGYVRKGRHEHHSHFVLARK